MISDLLSIPAVQKTIERKAYGEDLTSGKGWTTRMKPETEEALMAAPQFMSPLSKVAQLTKGMPVGASIKNVGGNWLTGSVEDALAGLKKGRVDDIWGNLPEDVIEKYRSVSDAHGVVQRTLPKEWAAAVAKTNPVDAWIDKQLTRYVKNDMATERDPIRALAERGTLHVNPEALNFRPEMHGKFLEPGQVPMGTSPAAKAWDGAADIKVYNNKAGAIVGNDSWVPAEIDANIANNPWLTKVPPDTPVHSIAEARSLPQDLGFNHLIDELRNATNPASGLPPELLLKYSSLPQVSVPQAVERVAAINAWREAQKVEANAAKANNAATVLHKDYPEKGFRWVELKKQVATELPPGYTLEEKPYNGYTLKRIVRPDGEGIDAGWFGHPNQGSPDPMVQFNSFEGNKALEDALKYEGDTMGHCVGGYCDDVAAGRSRIFSLRDSKGTPHTTIEVRPGTQAPEGALPWGELSPELQARMQARGIEAGPGEMKSTRFDPVTGLRHLQYDPSIVQIKGKANRAPNAEYLPYVQDFVKSGKWSEVGDIENAGLRRTRDVLNDLERKTLADKGHVFSDYMTEPERQSLQGLWDEGRTKGGEGFASGGLAQAPVQGYNPARVQEIADALRAELFN
jgi:hypothetical protein